MKSLFHLSGARPSPGRDWGFLLVGFILFLLVTLGWHLWLFNKVVNGESLVHGGAITTSNLHTDALNSVQDVFANRAAEELKYRNGEYYFIDPSK